MAPSAAHATESISTLKFADRAGRVMARVRPNEMVDDSVLLARANAEVGRTPPPPLPPRPLTRTQTPPRPGA